MAIKPEPVAAVQVECEICLKEVPASGAHIAEVEEYIMHFCGLECYKRWIESQQTKIGGEGN